MFPPAFPDFLHRHSCILGEGAVIERLRRQPATVLDPYLANSAFLYDPVKQAALEASYRQYLQIGRTHEPRIAACITAGAKLRFPAISTGL